MDRLSLNEKGTTLIELVVTLVISGMLLFFATALWTAVTERMQAASVQTNIQRAFTLARATAVHRRTVVTICPAKPDGTCSSDWQKPVAVFLDKGNAKKIEGDDQVIKRIPLLTAGRIIPSNSGSGPRRYFQFNPDGTSKGSIGNLTWCPSSRAAERAEHVRINFGGRLIWSRDGNGDGVVEDSSGNNIQCH